jgi:hypothetical protein
MPQNRSRGYRDDDLDSEYMVVSPLYEGFPSPVSGCIRYIVQLDLVCYLLLYM